MSETTPDTDGRSSRRGALSPVAALVREHDRDRFQTALFAPAAQREAVFALYAFNYEIARIREAVREEMLGRIRLQWWREAIDAAFSGQPPRRHDVIEALGRAINRYDLTQAHFERLIEAREEDLAAGPPPTLAALEDYCAASSARLVDLAAEILGAREAAEAARGVGIAYGLTGLLRAMPYHAAIGRSYIPEEFAVAPADYRNRRASPELHAAVAGIADLAARHLHAARARRDGVPRSALAAFLPAVIAGRYLVRLKRAAFDPFDPALAVPDALQSWRLLAASLRGRF